MPRGRPVAFVRGNWLSRMTGLYPGTLEGDKVKTRHVIMHSECVAPRNDRESQ